MALLWSGIALAQTPPAPQPAASAASAAASDKKADEKAKDDKAKDDKSNTVIVTGQRAALTNAQKIKQDAEEIVDSIVADDIGKLPDRSVTEVLQRIVGVTIDRTMAKNDPEHFSVEGSGVTIRGLSYVRSELNGRDSFSANGGRSLNFEDVPPELMSGVDVYKNPSAEQIEGGVGGLVNLRTALPFDFRGPKGSLSVSSSYSTLREKWSPSYSGMLSNRWDTDLGQFGALIDLAYSESATRTDAFQVEPYYPRTNVESGREVWIPKGSQWRTLNFDRERTGLYGALQWKKNDVDSSLTYFKSKYKMKWDENAIFAQSNPFNITVDPGATYDANGALLTGTLRDATDNGINFGADTRVANRNSDTQDLSWKVQWKASDKWSFSSDLQFIRATTNAFDSTVATGVLLPKQNVDFTGSIPRLNFDDADRAYLADPANYYWAFTMEHKDKSVANEKAWKGDAKFKFDHPVLSDLRFGVRLTDRDATTTNTVPGYNWAAITQPWMAYWYLAPGQLAYLSDPRFSGNTHLHTFNNFFNGKASVPSLVFPDTSTALGYPDSYATLHSYAKTLCTEYHNGDPSSCFDFWTPAKFGDDPSGTNEQRERTQAAYTQLRFGFDDWKYPVDGNVGLRLVHTSSKAQGYTVFTPPNGTRPDAPVFAAVAESRSFENSYTNALPSLNLRMKADDKLQFRFAYAKAMSRPDFSQLQAYTLLSENIPSDLTQPVTFSGTGSGNPLLKPVTADNVDVTAEWYYDRTSSFTVALFNKRLKDIIINQTYKTTLTDVNGQPYDFITTGPINGAKGTARGVELAFQTYFDKLPGWLSGFGVQANYTYIDSHQKLYQPVYSPYCASGNNASNLNLNLNGCDTNGQTFGDLPLANLSRNAYNLALLYDKGPFSARLAYSWRSKYLQAVNVNGTQGSDGTDPSSPNYGTASQSVAWGLPVWADDYGQLDLGIFYKFDNDLTIGFEGTNLTDSTYKQLMQQHVGLKGRAWFSVGPRYTLTMRYSF